MEAEIKFWLQMLILYTSFTSVLPLIRSDYWIIRIFDFPRFQKLVFSVILFIAYIAVVGFKTQTDQVYIVIMFANIIYLGYLVVPYTDLGKKQVIDAIDEPNSEDVSVVCWNVMQPNVRFDALQEIVERFRPDIFGLVEVDNRWAAAVEALRETYPEIRTIALDNTYGMAILSKFPLTSFKVMHLVESDVPSMHLTFKLKSGRTIALYLLHPKPPIPTESIRTTARDKELMLIADTIRHNSSPTLVIGDLNDVAWSYTTQLFLEVSGMLDSRRGRGFYNTFHAKRPLWRFPIDHIFASIHFSMKKLATLPAYGSDHFPMYAVFRFAPKNIRRQEPMDLTNQELKQAREKINKQV